MTQRVWPIHREWIRSLRCVSCRRPPPSDPHHVRTAANSGVAIKPHDWFLIPLCHTHHLEYHRLGRGRFEQEYLNGCDAVRAALAFAELSPDDSMRQAMMDAGWEDAN